MLIVERNVIPRIVGIFMICKYVPIYSCHIYLLYYFYLFLFGEVILIFQSLSIYYNKYPQHNSNDFTTIATTMQNLGFAIKIESAYIHGLFKLINCV